MNLKILFVVGFFILCSFLPYPAAASTFKYTAIVTTASGPHSSIFSKGETVEISYTLDPLVTDSNSDAQKGVYYNAVTSLSVVFPKIGISVTSGPSGTLQTFNNVVDSLSGKISDQVYFFGGPLVSSSQLEGEPINSVEVDFFSDFHVPPDEPIMLNSDALPLYQLSLIDPFIILEAESGGTFVHFANATRNMPWIPLLLLESTKQSQPQLVATGFLGAITYSSNGLNWSSATSSGTITTSKLFGIDYGKGRWVAVGGNWSPDHSRIIHSSDGDTWALAMDSGLTDPKILDDVAYDGSSRWVAIGSSGATIIHSADGDDWTVATSSGMSSVYPWGIAYGSGQWVAVGGGGTIIHSSDGDVWTAATSSGVTTTVNLESVSHDGTGRWVAVGGNYVPSQSTIIYSLDGDNWTEATDSGITMRLEDIAYGDNVWVAVGGDYNSNQGTIIYSTDGNAWTVASGSGITSHLMGVTYDCVNKLWIAVGRDGVITYSTNGNNWILSNDAGKTTDLYSIASKGCE